MAQGWDVESVSDAPPAAAGAGGWNVVDETPAVTVHHGGRVGGGGPAGVRPLSVEDATNLTGPRGLPAEFNDQDSLSDQVKGAADTAATGLAGFGSMVLKAGADIIPAGMDAVRVARNRIAGLPDNADADQIPNPKPITDFIDEHTHKPVTQGAKDVFGGIADVAHTVSEAANKVPGVKAFRESAAPFTRVAGDVAALTPAAGALGRVVKGTSEANAAEAAATAALPQNEQMVNTLNEAGFRIRPSTAAHMTGGGAKPSGTAIAAESAAGSDAVAADNIKHNKPIVNGWGASDIGLPRETVLTDDNLAKAEVPAQTTYDHVAGATAEPKVVSKATADALDATTEKDSLGRPMPGEHANTVSLLKTEAMSGQTLMDRVAKLRQEGYKRTSPTVPGGQVDPATEAYGNAQLDAANALEKELTDRVGLTNPTLLGRYQAARKLFAKINTIRRARVGYDIDPAKVAKAAAKSDALDGGLRIIADAYTHAPGDVALKVPAGAALKGTAGAASAGGAAAATIAAATGHPGMAAVAAGVPITQLLIRKGLNATRGERAASDIVTAPGSPLGHYFHGEPAAPPAPFNLTPPEGRAFEPHQPSILRSDENVPVAERGGLPPGLNLAPPEGTAFEPHQPSALRSGETVPAAESTQTPRPSVQLTPPLGDAFGPHQGELGLPAPEPSIDVYHGSHAAPDRFSNEHMGTGEGNQNFGHGQYVGTARGVGEHYVPEQGGYLTHARLPQRVADNALDLDKPLKDQPKVLKALGVDAKAAVKLNGINPEWTGRELHDALVKGSTNVGPRTGKTLTESAKAVADWLLGKGVTGTKYLDQVSRKAGAGTHNLVVFNPDEISVVSHEKLGDRIAKGKPTVGGELTADDLKLAE